MGVKKLTLHNFRGFRDAEIELKPLTILLGPNSAGKSSFGHALAAMAHAHRVFAGTPQASLTPALATRDSWPIDLGTLQDLRTTGTSGPVRVEMETDAGLIETGFGVDSIESLLPSYFRYPKGQLGIRTGEAPITGSTGGSRVEFIGQNLTPKEATYEMSQSTHYVVRRLNENQWVEDGVTSYVGLNGLVLDSITHQKGTAMVLSQPARQEIALLFENLAYLRANRRRPSRTYPLLSTTRDPNSPQEIGYAGEWTASVIHKYAQESVRYIRLPSIPDTVEQARLHRSERASPVSDSLVNSIAEWLQRLGLATSLQAISSNSHKGHLEIILGMPDQRERNLIEIGLGTSQVLPVLTAGLLQPRESLYIVDLPEAHLHPRPQAQLADFFCSLALSDRFSMVETHSEMFFHRLRLRAEMDDELKNKIAVYFIDQPVDGLCCQPRRVGLGLEDQFRWPAGFLQEAWEVEGQIAAVRQSKKQSIQK